MSTAKHRIKTTLDAAELARFNALCKSLGLSQSDAIRRALSLAFNLDLPVLWRQPESAIKPVSKARRESRRKGKK